jgi:hypothetical protein
MIFGWTMPMSNRNNSVFSPLEHYVFPTLDVECCCDLCQNWRTERVAFDEIKAVTFNHDRACMCWRCKKRRRLQQSFLAASSKRELFCELSWHAARHAKTYGPRLMVWVTGEIMDNTVTDGWWATLGQSYPISYWLLRFQSAFTSASCSGSAVVTLVSGVAA